MINKCFGRLGEIYDKHGVDEAEDSIGSKCWICDLLEHCLKGNTQEQP